MSNKNRAVVKDGRLQVKKKRTDRSYLQPQSQEVTATSDVVEESTPEAATEPVASAVATAPAEAPAPTPASAPDPVSSFAPPPPAAAAPMSVAAAVAVPRAGAARALQQQGVRKRREIDLNEVARRDSSYAMHELRRIAILTVMVVVTLVVLAIALR